MRSIIVKIYPPFAGKCLTRRLCGPQGSDGRVPQRESTPFSVLAIMNTNARSSIGTPPASIFPSAFSLLTCSKWGITVPTSRATACSGDAQDHPRPEIAVSGRVGEALKGAQAGSSRPPPRQVSRARAAAFIPRIRQCHAISVLGARRDTVRRARPRDSVARCALCNVVAPAQPNPPNDIVAERSR
jgi:hypothetical protein